MFVNIITNQDFLFNFFQIIIKITRQEVFEKVLTNDKIIKVKLKWTLASQRELYNNSDLIARVQGLINFIFNGYTFGLKWWISSLIDVILHGPSFFSQKFSLKIVKKATFWIFLWKTVSKSFYFQIKREKTGTRSICVSKYMILWQLCLHIINVRTNLEYSVQAWRHHLMMDIKLLEIVQQELQKYLQFLSSIKRCRYLDISTFK